MAVFEEGRTANIKFQIVKCKMNLIANVKL